MCHSKSWMAEDEPDVSKARESAPAEPLPNEPPDVDAPVLRRPCTPPLDRIIRSGHGAHRTEMLDFLSYDAAKRAVKKISQRHRLDAVHARSGDAGVLAAFAAARKLP